MMMVLWGRSSSSSTATTVLLGCGAGLVVSLAVSYGATQLVLRYHRWRTNPLRRAPGPPVRTFFLGYFPQIMKQPFLHMHAQWWKEAQQQYGSSRVPLLAYSSMLGLWSVVILDPALVQTILTDPSEPRYPVRFPKKYFLAREIIGDGLVTLQGRAWARHRRIIQPSFQVHHVKQALDPAVAQHVATLIQAWRRAPKNTTIIDAFAHLSAVTLDVIGQVGFAHEFGTSNALLEWAEQAANRSSTSAAADHQEHEIPATQDPLQQALQASFQMQSSSVILAVLGLAWLDKYVNGKAQRTRAVLNAAVDQIIREARDKNERRHRKPKSLLQLLLDAKDAEDTTSRKSLTDRELRDEIKTFILAGHETTATWCYWALFALAKYPALQQKVYADISKHAPSDNTETPLLTLDAIDQMSYFGAFMLEVLRVYTPVGVVIRFTSQEECFMGYTVPKNTRLVIPFLLLHRHPDHWTDPEEFRPERWLDETEMAKRHPYCFLPFSTGHRNCIGQRFAEMEAKLIVANIARAFTVQFAANYDESAMTLTNFLTMKAKPALKLSVSPR